jgi:Initiator Rep protein, WH2
VAKGVILLGPTFELDNQRLLLQAGFGRSPRNWIKSKLANPRVLAPSLEELRWVFGLESIKDADGNVIKEAPLPVWANFQQLALDVAILEVNAKTDLKIKLASIERLKHRRVVALNFAMKTQPIPKGQRD